jgi:hypothetical protein
VVINAVGEAGTDQRFFRRRHLLTRMRRSLRKAPPPLLAVNISLRTVS